MLKKLTGAAIGLAMAAAASGASAAVVYNNPFDPGAEGNEITRWVQASSFSLGVGASITGGSVAIGGTGGDVSNWDGAFDYWFFNDAAGPMPGTILESGAASVNSVTDTGTPWSSAGSVWEVDFDLASAFDAVAGTTYWLGIHLSTNFDRDEIYWVRSTTNQSASESLEGTFDNWQTYSPAKAFTLNDDPLAPIPVPASLPLVLAGLGGLAVLRRRKKVA